MYKRQVATPGPGRHKVLQGEPLLLKPGPRLFNRGKCESGLLPVSVSYTHLDVYKRQQTQNGNGMTNHLRKKLLLIDRNANAIDQTFNLALRCDILRFCLGGIPQDAGTLSRLIYTVETATGVFTSMTLNMTGVTISASLDSITAFLAFDPAVMGIAEDGKVTIRLVGNKIYEWSKIITLSLIHI